MLTAEEARQIAGRASAWTFEQMSREIKGAANTGKRATSFLCSRISHRHLDKLDELGYETEQYYDRDGHNMLRVSW